MSDAVRHRWLLLVIVGAGLLLITLDNSILYTALPTLTIELDANHDESLWIINAYPLVMTGLLLGTGTLGDKFGHRRLFLIGLVVFGAASLIAAFAPTVGVLIASRALLAVGAAAMMPATLALIRVTFTDVKERAFAIAIWGSISVVGMALGPIIGGLLLEAFWWGAVFLVNVPVVVLAIVGTVVFAPVIAPNRAARWDAVSSTFAMVGLTGLVFAIKESAKGSFTWVLAAAIVATIAGLALFARRQGRLEQPMLDFSIFRNAAVSAGVIAAAAGLFMLAGIQLVGTQRFQLVAGFSPTEAGLLVSVLAVASLPTSLLTGALLHRIGLLVSIAGGFAVSAVGSVVVALAFQESMPWLIAGLAVVGAGLGLVFGVASTAIIGNVPSRRAGMASAVEEVSFELGGLIAVAVLGSVVSAVFSSALSLPGGVDAAAGEGIVESIEIAEGMGAAGAELLASAAAAYDVGFLVVMIVVAAVAAAAAIACGVLLRRYGPGTESGSHD